MRYTPETVLAYLRDPRDRVLLMQNPVIPMPRFGQLPTLDLGERRYVMAADGLYVQARTQAIEACVAIANTPPLPFGELEPKIELAGGLLPHAFFARIRDEALSESPNEWAALVHWDAVVRDYRWTPTDCLYRSTSGVQYRSDARDESRLFLDVHSHGLATPEFSNTDDESDRYGVYFASVIGCCASRASVRVCTRLVIDDLRIPLDWNPWEPAPGVAIADSLTNEMLDSDHLLERLS